MARESQQMAVLFADISDSSYLYKALGDVPARGIVNSCLALMGGVVVRHNGRIIKTIGDEIMCAFARADDAVLAASEIQAQVDAKRPGDRHIKIHSGLHYGPVLIEGNDIFGYTVNAAAYLTAVAAPEQILTTDAIERTLAHGTTQLRAPRVPGGPQGQRRGIHHLPGGLAEGHGGDYQCQPWRAAADRGRRGQHEGDAR